MTSFGQRFVGAALLSVPIYEEVEADDTATTQAMAVVVLAALCSGIGLGVRSGVRGLVAGTLTALFGWFVWAGLTHFIGTRFLPTAQTESTWGQVLRTTGFAAAPGVLRVFYAIPNGGILIYIFMVFIWIWMLVAFVIAVRQALDYTSTWRAVGVCLAGWMVFVLVNFMTLSAS